MFPVARPTLLRSRGHARRARGDVGRAARWYRASRDAAARLGMMGEAALADAALHTT
jgi:hypothetical protein